MAGCDYAAELRSTPTSVPRYSRGGALTASIWLLNRCPRGSGPHTLRRGSGRYHALVASARSGPVSHTRGSGVRRRCLSGTRSRECREYVRSRTCWHRVPHLLDCRSPHGRGSIRAASLDCGLFDSVAPAVPARAAKRCISAAHLIRITHTCRGAVNVLRTGHELSVLRHL